MYVLSCLQLFSEIFSKRTTAYYLLTHSLYSHPNYDDHPPTSISQLWTCECTYIGLMQRPRNRQGRPPGQNSRPRGARGGGRQPHPGSSQRVPITQQVHTGAFVSIVLKIDQPTGREVQGVVADVLTSGDHPRGIKVRLRDGRVGRVQRMVSEEEAQNGSAGLSNVGRNGEGLNGSGISSSASMRPRFRQNDHAREDMDEPASSYSLESFLPAGHPLREDRSNTLPPAFDDAAGKSASQVCPVCNRFEGDEVAVSHHVATHFD